LQALKKAILPKSRLPLSVEDIHTPNPLPARGIYGFALYISSICFLTLYILWAVVPTPILKHLGITYVPAKYWVIAIPSLIIFSLSTFVFVVLVSNIYRFGGYRIFEEVEERPQAIQLLSHVFFKTMFLIIHDSCISGNNHGDRGYFVSGDVYIDDYILGSTTDFPDDEITLPSREQFGPVDAVEHIEFQLPCQSDNEVCQTCWSVLDCTDDSGALYEDIEQIGTVNQLREAIDKRCSACGAHLHCKSSSLPGFLPEELLEKAARKKLPETVLCRRCHLLKHYSFLLNVNVCEVDYESMMSCLRLNCEALVILIVDVTDIPGSIHRQLPRIIGPGKPMIVVANKVDLLPPDARCGYLKRFKLVVEDAITKAGFREQFVILHTALVSARTGYGVEDLITEIYLKYTNIKLGVRNDIYLIGCTNAGKSSLFNALLQSDLCKVHAIDVVERATTSIWPGTTLSLLKFPVMRPTTYRLELRRRRLLQTRAWLKKEMYSRLGFFFFPEYTIHKCDPLLVQRRTVFRWSLQDELFKKGMWCYDTPGTINNEQVLNMFTLDELIHVLPRHLLQPRTALVPTGYSLLIGGIARVDVEECAKDGRLLLTTFASDDLPLNCMRTCDVDEFLKENLGTDALVVPRGKERLSQWRGMESCVFELSGRKNGGAVADIVLSSIGWVLVTSSSPLIRIRSYTPCGKGLTTRMPILPFAADLRGKRIAGTRFYKVEPMEFPVNVRRQKALKKRKTVSEKSANSLF
uniref:G domain-containing protein n=1 Tax=Angiostrongylus cantonensis TaxID=6313 RepID=A0A0K0DJA0_ANGCA